MNDKRTAAWKYDARTKVLMLDGRLSSAIHSSFNIKSKAVEDTAQSGK